MYKLALLAILISANAYAGLFDSFKDPATLILDQKDCQLGQANGEIVKGNFIFRGATVVAKLKKVDKNRVSYESDLTQQPLVLNVKMDNKQLFASLPNGRVIIACNL